MGQQLTLFPPRINVEEQFTRDREQLQGISGANYTSNDTYTSSEEEAQQSYREMCIYVYTAVVVAVVVVSLVRSCLFVVVCMRASINLHNSMFEAVTRATMYFFNTNSSGERWQLIPFICLLRFYHNTLMFKFKFPHSFFLTAAMLVVVCKYLYLHVT